jgi:transposase
MLSPGPTTRIFVGLDPVDMRGSFDALAGHVRRLHREPLDGHLYLFVNRKRRLLKALWFDRTGWALYSKRLERGTFELPQPTGDARQVQVDPAQLAMILEGIDLRARRRLRYQRPSRSPTSPTARSP